MALHAHHKSPCTCDSRDLQDRAGKLIAEMVHLPSVLQCMESDEGNELIFCGPHDLFFFLEIACASLSRALDFGVDLQSPSLIRA